MLRAESEPRRQTDSAAAVAKAALPSQPDSDDTVAPPTKHAQPLPVHCVVPKLKGTPLVPDEPDLSPGMFVDVRDTVGKWLEGGTSC